MYKLPKIVNPAAAILYSAAAGLYFVLTLYLDQAINNGIVAHSIRAPCGLHQNEELHHAYCSS